jgi:hypothetical protein
LHEQPQVSWGLKTNFQQNKKDSNIGSRRGQKITLFWGKVAQTLETPQIQSAKSCDLIKEYPKSSSPFLRVHLNYQSDRQQAVGR